MEDCFSVHAGAVSKAGRAVAFPAASGAGKSTLTAACLRAGLDYVSDEALCLSWSDGAVQPYPRALSLSPWSRAAVGLPPGPESVSPAELGAEVAAGEIELAHVLLLTRGDRVELEPASRQEVAAALLRRSFTHWARPERAFELAHAVAARTSAWRLTLGDPLQAADAVAALLA